MIKPIARSYIGPEDQGAVQEDSIILSNGKVMHHDSSRDGDGHAALNAVLCVCHLVRHMRLGVHIVPKEEQFTCKEDLSHTKAGLAACGYTALPVYTKGTTVYRACQAGVAYIKLCDEDIATHHIFAKGI